MHSATACLAACACVALLEGCGSGHSQPMPQDRSMPAPTTIPGPQGRLAVYRSGTGDGMPVLFLHSDAGRAAQWREVMVTVSTARPVIAIDFRGHGDSEPARNDDYSYAARGTDVGAVVDALGLQRVVIVAHSGGVAAALEHAAAHPGRVAGILMVDPLSDPRWLPKPVRDKFVSDLAGAQSLEVMRGFYSSIAGKNNAVRQRVLADVDRVSPRARPGIGKAFAEWIPEPTLNAFTGPMSALVTEPGDNAGALFRLRPGIPHRVVANSGHWIQLDQPRIVENAITEFVAAVESGSSRRRDGTH